MPCAVLSRCREKRWHLGRVLSQISPDKLAFESDRDALPNDRQPGSCLSPDSWREQDNSHPIRPGQNYQRNPLVSSTTRRQGQRGCRPFPLHPQSPPDLLRFASDHLSRTISLDEAEHFLHNHHASVASLRLLFTFTPERRSACLRNRCSPSPEYPAETVQALNEVKTPVWRRHLCAPVHRCVRFLRLPIFSSGLPIVTTRKSQIWVRFAVTWRAVPSS